MSSCIFTRHLTPCTCAQDGNDGSQPSLVSQLLPSLAFVPRLRTLHAHACLSGLDVVAFAGLAPLHLRSLVLDQILDGLTSQQLGACLGRLTALTELEVSFGEHDEEFEDPRPGFPAGLLKCTALHRLSFDSVYGVSIALLLPTSD